MRLDEIFSQPVTNILVSNEFINRYDVASKTNPDVVPRSLLLFSQSKIAGTPVTGKEEKFHGSGAHLANAGVWHWPIIHGKLILLYKQIGNTLRYYSIVTHKEYDGPVEKSVARRITNLTDDQFIKIDPELFFKSEDEKTDFGLTQKEKDILYTEIYLLISQKAFFILKPAIKDNDWSEFEEWILTTLPNRTIEQVFDVFNGKDQLNKFLMDHIKQYGYFKEYQQSK